MLASFHYYDPLFKPSMKKLSSTMHDKITESSYLLFGELRWGDAFLMESQRKGLHTFFVTNFNMKVCVCMCGWGGGVAGFHISV